MINKRFIYKFFEDFTNHKKKINTAVGFSAVQLSPTFLNTGTTHNIF